MGEGKAAGLMDGRSHGNQLVAADFPQQIDNAIRIGRGESGGRLVQEEKHGSRNQLVSDIGPFSLSAAQTSPSPVGRTDQCVEKLGGPLALETELPGGILDQPVANALPHVGKLEPQAIVQGLLNGQVREKNISLRHISDEVAKHPEIPVGVEGPSNGDQADIRFQIPGQQIEENGLTATGRSHDRGQAPGRSPQIGTFAKP